MKPESRVGLITETIEKTGAGLGRYASCLAEQLELLIPANLTLIHRQQHPFYEGRNALRVDVPDLKVVGKQFLLPLRLRKEHFSLIHDTYHFPPFLLPAANRRVMTVFDITPVLLDTHPLRSRLAHSLLLGTLARRADKIIAISEHTKKDLVNHYGIPSDRVVAIPLAAPESFGPLPEGCSLEEERRAHGLPAKYFLCLGTLEPRRTCGASSRPSRRSLAKIRTSG